jgi:hypothetical protein
MKTPIRIVSHGPIFDGAAKLLQYELQMLGRDAQWIENKGDWQKPLPAGSEAGALNIFIGPVFHTAKPFEHSCVFWNFDLYNFNGLVPPFDYFEAGYVWEYAPENKRQFSHPNQSVLKPGWSPAWIGNENEKGRDIEVLFTGASSARRGQIIAQIKGLGIKVEWDAYWGKDLAEMLSRARIVLNLHAYEERRQFPTLRCYPAIQAGALLVTEPCSDEADYPGFKWNLQPRDRADIPLYCKEILENFWDKTDRFQQHAWLRTNNFTTKDELFFREELKQVLEKTERRFGL